MTRYQAWLECRCEVWARRPGTSRRCALLHHGQDLMDPPNTSMWRDDPRLFGEFPSDNLSSVPSCDQRAQQAAATTKQRSHT